MQQGVDFGGELGSQTTETTQDQRLPSSHPTHHPLTTHHSPLLFLAHSRSTLLTSLFASCPYIISPPAGYNCPDQRDLLQSVDASLL